LEYALIFGHSCGYFGVVVGFADTPWYIIRQTIMLASVIQRVNQSINERVTNDMSPDKTGIKVVYVGDDPGAILLFTLILEKAGFEVTGANGSRAGLSAIEQISPALVVLDLRMPDGWSTNR
jgi:PleD family two-component response regulator